MENWRNKAYGALRWSEKYTQADMVYLAKGNFWQVSGQVVSNVLSLALIFVFANYLPKETYGLYRYILSLAGILGIFALTEMNQAIGQAVASGDDGVLRASVRYQLKWNTLQIVAFFGLGAYYFYNGNTPIALSLFAIGIFSPLAQAFNTYGAYLDGKRQFRLNNIFSVISTAIYVISMMTVIIISGDIVWLIVTYSVVTFLTTAALYMTTLRIFKPPTTEASGALKYGRELTFISWISPVVSQIDKIILTHFWGATQLALYSLSMAVPGRATSFIKSLADIGFVKFSTKTPEELNKVFYIRIFQGLSIGAICTIGYIAVAPYLFQYLIPKYLDALFYSQLLSVSFLFAMPNRYISLLLSSQKFSRIIFINNMIQNAIRLCSYIVLGIWGGLLGLIIAQISNSLISLLTNIFMWRKNTRT